MALHDVRSHRVAGSPRLLGAIAVTVALFAVAGCGSGSSSGSGSGSVDSSAATSAAKAVAADYQGTYESPPTTPTNPPAGKNVWVISCGQAAIGCAAIANGAKEAAEKAGFDTTLYDGKLGADDAYATGVRQAIAAKADAIILGSIDCPLVKAPLQQAKAAGIKVIGLLAYDCSDPRYGGGSSLFTANVIPNQQQQTVSEYARALGRAKADWVIDQTKAKAVALSLTHKDSLLGTDIASGFDDQLKTCTSCTLESMPFTFAQLGAGQVPAMVTQALVKNPSINAVTTPYDSLMLLGVAQAIVRSGRNDQIASIGGEAYAPNLALIKKNAGEDAAVFEDANWFGWASVDTLSRVFNGEEPQPAGIGYQLVDAAHMPKMVDGNPVPPIDYQAAYLKAWGK